MITPNFSNGMRKHAVVVVVLMCLVIFSVYQTIMFLRKSNEPSCSLQSTCSCTQDPPPSTSPLSEQASRTSAASEQLPTEPSGGHAPNGQKCPPMPPSSSACSAPGLPEMVFVAGIEGSGHHVILSLFESLKKGPGNNSFALFEHVPQLHLLEPGLMLTIRQLGFAFIQKETLRQRIDPLIDKMTEIQLQGGKGALIAANSFSMGFGGILSTARPDLLMLKHFHCKLYKLKIIVTKRHPMPALFSTVSRFGWRFSQMNETLAQNKDKLLKDMPIGDLRLIMQARLFEDQLIYLNQQLQNLQEECSIHMHVFEMDKLFITNTKQSELNHLADFLDLTKEERKSLLKTQIIPHEPFQLPPLCTLCLNRTLYDFFEERKEMWPLLI